MLHLLLVSDIVVNHIFPQLTDLERLRLISVDKNLVNKFRTELWFDEMYGVGVGSINKWYWNQLRNIFTSGLTIFPRKVEKIIFSDRFNDNIKD